MPQSQRRALVLVRRLTWAMPHTNNGNRILSLHQYINTTREQLNPKEAELFPGDLHNITSLLTEELKGINLKIKNALHIRSYVILHWLRQHSKRQVQYMCGHKHIDSTERYQVQEMESLINQLQKHHPFG